MANREKIDAEISALLKRADPEALARPELRVIAGFLVEQRAGFGKYASEVPVPFSDEEILGYLRISAFMFSRMHSDTFGEDDGTAAGETVAEETAGTEIDDDISVDELIARAKREKSEKAEKAKKIEKDEAPVPHMPYISAMAKVKESKNEWDSIVDTYLLRAVQSICEDRGVPMGKGLTMLLMSAVCRTETMARTATWELLDSYKAAQNILRSGLGVDTVAFRRLGTAIEQMEWGIEKDLVEGVLTTPDMPKGERRQYKQKLKALKDERRRALRRSGKP